MAKKENFLTTNRDRAALLERARKFLDSNDYVACESWHESYVVFHESELALLQAILPATFYAGAPFAHRLKMMVEGWQAAVRGCIELTEMNQAIHRLDNCPCCAEPREQFEATTRVDVNGKDCVTESCGWCGSSYLRETLNGHTGVSPKAITKAKWSIERGQR